MAASHKPEELFPLSGGALLVIICLFSLVSKRVAHATLLAQAAMSGRNGVTG
jgi:hypothetical protein